MGLGSTAKKLQQVVDLADDLYAKINDLKSDMAAMRQTIEDTEDGVERIEDRLDEQERLLEAIADAEGVELPTEDDEGTESADTDQDAA